MHCQTSRNYSSLFFFFLFILNFESLNTESNSILNNLQENKRNDDRSKSQSNSTTCTDCSSTSRASLSASQPTVLPSNSSLLSKISPGFSNASTNSDQTVASGAPVSQINLKPLNHHSITFRSTPDFVLLPDSPFAALQTAKLQGSRKKQLDLDLEPVNVKSDLNYRLDESPTAETRDNDEANSESEDAKVKLKQNDDTQTSKVRKENSDPTQDKETADTENSKLGPQIDRTGQANRHLTSHITSHLTRQTEMQPDKQVERQANRQSDRRSEESADRPTGLRAQPANSHQPADKPFIDKQFGQEAASQGVASHRQINERRNEPRNSELRNRRLNEQQLIRRLKPSRQPATQSNFSILRRFYPTATQPQANANQYTVEDARLATLEIVKVQREGRCKAPAKRVIPISKLLNNSQQIKKFLPHCTILHRCETETGCCNSESEQCSVKKQEPVRLPFWVISLSADGQQFKTIEWFTFHNHTECECRMK